MLDIHFARYTALLSMPMFAAIVFTLIKQISSVDYSRHTVSRTIMLLRDKRHKMIYRFNFVFKSMLDLIFAVYVVQALDLSLFSPISLSLVLSSFIFGSLAYYVEGEHSLTHKKLVYAFITLWGFSQIGISYLTGDQIFFGFTVGSTVIMAMVSFYYMYKNIANVYLQGLFSSLHYLWLLIFVVKYLQ